MALNFSSSCPYLLSAGTTLTDRLKHWGAFLVLYLGHEGLLTLLN